MYINFFHSMIQIIIMMQYCFSLILIACGYTGVYRWQVTNIKHAFAFHDLVQRLDYDRKHVYMSIHCLQITITTPERGS